MRRLNRTVTGLFLIAVLTPLTGAISQEWQYIDVADPIQSGAINTFNSGDNQPNSWGMGADGDAETTAQWRFRNSGPGAPAFNGTAYTGRQIDGDPAIYTILEGLTSGSEYEVRVYGVFPSNPSSRFGAEVSVDGGGTWTMVDNKDWDIITWVDASSGVGEPLAEQTPSGDTRFYFLLPGKAVADGEGKVRIDLQLPVSLSDGSAQDKFNIDGYAVKASSGAAPAPVYVDVADPIQSGAINTFNAGDSQPNSWGMGADGDADTTAQWRFRNSGPGAPAFGTTAYTGRFIDNDPAIYTIAEGLEPGFTYKVRVYGVFPSNPSSRFGAEVSLDGGNSWTMVDNKDWGMITWVDNASDLGTALPEQTPSGDTRFYYEMPGTLTADTEGKTRVDLRLPQTLSDGSAQDKFNIDGYGFIPSESAPDVQIGIADNGDGTVTLTWDGPGVLVSSPDAAGTEWAPVDGATSPHTYNASSEATFFQIQAGE